MNSIPFAFMFVFCIAVWEFGSTNPVALSCDSCGSECARACGTRHFRSCCFNYVRKRSSPIHPLSLNKLRYEMLYRKFPYGKISENLSNKMEQEQKPRKPESPPSYGIPTESEAGSSPNEINEDVNLNQKNYYKPWKDNSPVGVVDVDYNDPQASEPKQQTMYEFA